jgi:hypothetical protein
MEDHREESIGQLLLPDRSGGHHFLLEVSLSSMSWFFFCWPPVTSVSTIDNSKMGKGENDGLIAFWPNIGGVGEK